MSVETVGDLVAELGKFDPALRVRIAHKPVPVGGLFDGFPRSGKVGNLTEWHDPGGAWVVWVATVTGGEYESPFAPDVWNRHAQSPGGSALGETEVP